MRLERPTAPCATSPRPRTWITTVRTIKGKPHAQSARQLPGTTTTLLITAWAIPIETSFGCLLNRERELSVHGREAPRSAHSILRHVAGLSSQINIQGCAESAESPD